MKKNVPLPHWKSNQENQGFSGNQKKVIQGQRPDTKIRHTQQRTLTIMFEVSKIIHTK